MNLALIAILLAQTGSATTEHYEVLSTGHDRDYAKAVAEALEAAYPAFIETLGVKPAEKARYRIHLYATVKEYQDVEKALTGGKFASNLAFSHIETGESHLVIQPREAMRPLPDKFRALVRHEAFHLVAFRHAVAGGRSAPWLEEGLADLAAETADRLGGAEPMAASIEFANAVHRIRALRKETKLFPLGWLLEEDPSGLPEARVSAWYEQSWLFVKYLKERREKQWIEFLKRFHQAGKPAVEAEWIPLVKDLLLKSLGDPILDVEKDWHAWIDRLKPAPWWRIEDGGDWRLTRDGVEGAARSDRATYLISAGTFKGERYRLRAEAQILEGGTGQVDLVLTPPAEDRDAGDLVKAVAMRGGEASILVRRQGEWKTMANRAFDGRRLAPDKWVSLELEVDGRTVRLKVGGEVAVEHIFEDKVDELHHVRWGLGNYDSWIRFRAIDIREN